MLGLQRAQALSLLGELDDANDRMDEVQMRARVLVGLAYFRGWWVIKSEACRFR